MTRSESDRIAAERYVDELEGANLTRRIDDAIALALAGPGEEAEEFRRAAGAVVSEDDW
ncbi:hypothetical protein [Cellulomonas composti]|uniref:Uncharacterized protein n=1 Tax=Cellulomonas composti TaxID=266130 RepID=A0A511JA15_9CELL|nr:hypothetical protein [Cellulomonas composti]GEL94837.1 hypothetical protein CCO02nite_14950 [Cellulomonas composti]